VVWHFLQMAIYVRPAKPIAHFVADMMALGRDVERIASGFFALMLFTLFISTFSYFKSIVPFLNDFKWDTTFAEWDRALHFGRDPYVWLAPIFGNPLATTVLNAFYHLWFFLVYFIVFLACFSARNSRSGAVFLLSLVLTFIIGGNFLATVFSSAGPVYYERLGFGADFAPLMDNLYQFNEIMPVWALDVQEALWQSHIDAGPISGISAMPSMHVASSTLLAFYGMRHARWAGIALGLFAVMIMIGSVQLGWHYAIDGYLGALLAWACWRLAEFLIGRFQPV
jgi:membrane-associated phospholipid phosphatase